MKALFKTAKSTCFECEARTCFLLFFDDGEEKEWYVRKWKDILMTCYIGVLQMKYDTIFRFTRNTHVISTEGMHIILKTNKPTSMNHLDGSQRSPWCKFPLRSSEKGWILQTFSRMIHWRIFPWKLNMSPENQWLEDVLPTEIVPTIRGRVSFPGCIVLEGDDLFCYARELGVAPPSNLWISPMLAVYPVWVVIYILWTRQDSRGEAGGQVHEMKFV